MVRYDSIDFLSFIGMMMMMMLMLMLMLTQEIDDETKYGFIIVISDDFYGFITQLRVMKPWFHHS